MKYSLFLLVLIVKMTIGVSQNTLIKIDSLVNETVRCRMTRRFACDARISERLTAVVSSFVEKEVSLPLTTCGVVEPIPDLVFASGEDRLRHGVRHRDQDDHWLVGGDFV